MKLATYKDGSRNGQLVVVSRDLMIAHYATGIANTLQQVLDDWNFYAPQLQDLYAALNRAGDHAYGASRVRHAFPFDPYQCMAPLPRAYQWVQSSAYFHQVELLRQSRGEDGPGSLATGPLLSQSGSDDFLGPCDKVVCANEAFGIDFCAGLAAITGDVPMGVSPAQALEGVRLRNLMTGEAAAFSPVAVTLDELSSHWDKGRLSLTLQSIWNGRKVGMCETGPDMTFHFGELIAHRCKTRNVRAGAIFGTGPVSNRDASRGYSCIAEKRAIEILQNGQPVTGFMKYGDTIRIDMKGPDGQSLFGAIEQEIAPLANA